MPFARRPLLALFALLLALGLAACGEDRDKEGTATKAQTETSSKETAGAAAETVKVSETEYSFDPANPKVSKSGVVQFDVTNDGKTEHALEVEAPGGEVKTEAIEPGGKATLKADLKPGTYEWYCPIANHKDLGMKGRIKVAGGGGGNSGSGSSGSGGSDDPYK